MDAGPLGSLPHSGPGGDQVVASGKPIEFEFHPEEIVFSGMGFCGLGEQPHIYNVATNEIRPLPAAGTYTVDAKAGGVVAAWHGVTQEQLDQLRAIDPAARTLADMVRVMGVCTVDLAERRTFDA